MAVKPTKLGMKIEGPKRPKPYETLDGRVKQGAPEQQKLEKQFSTETGEVTDPKHQEELAQIAEGM